MEGGQNFFFFNIILVLKVLLKIDEFLIIPNYILFNPFTVYDNF